jgi:hypothetical protein
MFTKWIKAELRRIAAHRLWQPYRDPLSVLASIQTVESRDKFSDQLAIGSKRERCRRPVARIRPTEGLGIVSL